MADIKKKGSLEKPKVKTSGFVPKEAASVIKEKYQEQKERNAPGQKDPVRYATDKVEGGGKRVARTAVMLSSRRPNTSSSSSGSAKKPNRKTLHRKTSRSRKTNRNSRLMSRLPRQNPAHRHRMKRLSKLSRPPHPTQRLWMAMGAGIPSPPKVRVNPQPPHNTMGKIHPQNPPDFPQPIGQITMQKHNIQGDVERR